MATLWRIVKHRHSATAFDGNGARRFGGRWNSPGLRAVYASGSKSLATLEPLVHLDAQSLPRLVAFAFTVADDLIESLPARRLPAHWRRWDALSATQQIGDAWLAARRHLALAVPSAVIPEERNYLLNPEHPAFARLRFGRPVPLVLDPRPAG